MRRFFLGKRPDPLVQRLYDDVVRQARRPVFYQEFLVPDTLDGRFEMVLLHVCAVVDQLREEDASLAPEGQALFDTFVADMEQNLRTVGVSDVAVPKRMKKVGEAFYGRFDAYRKAKSPGEMAAAVRRNLYGGSAIGHREEGPVRSRGTAGTREIEAMAAYALALFDALQQADLKAGPLPFPDADAYGPSVDAQNAPSA